VREQVVRRLVHPTAQARGAKATTGAREGDQSRQAAIFARQVREASLHDATVEVPRELGAHKVRQSGLPPFLDGRIEESPGFPAPPGATPAQRGRACAESFASENASRLAAMERADKNIDELLESLNGSFHRLRQSGIDEELFDVISGFEALVGP
jgi:hypothetical protein